jgi:hypothetical protein
MDRNIEQMKIPALKYVRKKGSDAGASPTHQASQRESKRQPDKPTQILSFSWI